MAKDTGEAGGGDKSAGKAASKAAKAQARAARRAARKERNGQLKQAFTMTRKADPKMLPIVLGAVVGIIVVFLAIGLLIGAPFIMLGIGLPLAALAGLFLFGRRAQTVAMGQVEGQIGAAAAVAENMRGNWRTTPMVGFTQQQDLLHRVIGRPGIVLLAEGAPQHTDGLVRAERKRLQRLVGNVPVYDVSVGDGEGQVPVRKLQQHLAKLPKNITPAQVNEVDRRLAAIGNAGLPLPKGPVPKSPRAASRRVR
jgi:hypothetical protein